MIKLRLQLKLDLHTDKFLFSFVLNTTHDLEGGGGREGKEEEEEEGGKRKKREKGGERERKGGGKMEGGGDEVKEGGWPVSEATNCPAIHSTMSQL